MPRRNCNAKVRSIDIDRLATDVQDLASELSIMRTCAPVCTTCWSNPATEGDYCLLCKGQIISSARETTVKRR
ncbi:MAG TPA: hypothetical protein VLW50_18090 [Streptosporangiaceae bacterium]|nr:hypothetical protein [Streptosporangiaceae bacterium]